jgi:hypothetical protein
MTVEETQRTLKATALDEASERYSADWWQMRSPQELREIIKRGFGLGTAYDGAIAETERRARDALKKIREGESQSRRKMAVTRLYVLSAVLALVIGVGIFEWLMG